ncbi:DNA-binding protein [Gordonibacter sp. 28C]|uniref:DNA-binding protein n=1 Tax=Gordonibacter sp. 28C TaxID=2078569 RepID=UPI000DF79712|nr:DNA-binding protein [Gordonibacter sp. 28C]RDB61237.1 DNA-binding protein [Gordonibacter sp. 28C]
MAFDLTVAEAAALLGVSRPRAYQLVESGALSAEKAGGIWLVDRASVEARMAEGAARGGRRGKAKDASAVRTFELMNRTHRVLSFDYDVERGAFVEAGDVTDAARAPLGMVSPRAAKASVKALEHWWKHRAIPGSRAGMQAKLAELGYEAAYQIPFRNLGLSLSDQYWIRPAGGNIRWEDVNYFDNDFADMKVGSPWLSGVGLDSPDNTSEGQLPKKWVRDGGALLLAKGGSVLNQEPYNETVATALHRRLLQPGEYLAYRLREGASGAVCLCEDFVSPEEEYLPAFYVRRSKRQANHHSDYRHYLECCVALGVEGVERSLEKMIVCDDILGNFDRHWRNFGLVRNVETLECRVAPLFDSGNSLWCDAPVGRLRAGDFSFAAKPFYEDPNRQLRLVQDYSWLDLDALDGFADEAAGILSQNRAISDRVDLVCCGIQARIDRIKRIL